MGNSWSAIGTRAKLVAVGGALLATGVGVGAGAAVSSPDTRPVSEESAVTAPAATTSAAPTTAAAPTEVVVAPPAEPVKTTVVQQPAAPPPAATVQDVTAQDEAPAPAPAPAPVPADQDRSGIGTTGADGNYTPAPPIQKPGEPPYGGDAGANTVEPLPGEPGYTG